MAKKINAETAKTLKNLGITAKTEEEAHAKLVAALEKEGIEGMEDESLAALIDMADGFLNNDSESEDEVDEVEADTDEEMDELADEVEAEEAEDEEELEEEEAEDEVEEEEPVKPVKKAPAKKEVKSTKTKKQKTSSRGQKLDPKNNPEDREVLNEVKELFDEKYSFDYLVSNGVTIKYVGKNGKRGIVTIENILRKPDGTITCNMYLLTMAKQTEILDELGINNYFICWTKAPGFKNITLDEAKEIIEKVFDVILDTVAKIDKRLGNNRKKMEENLKKTEKKSSKSKKAVEPEPEEEEVEEEVEEPVKKATKKTTPVKKAASKKAKK